MSLDIIVAVNTAEIGTFAGVVSGDFSGTATVAAGNYAHITFASITTLGTFTALAAAVQTALQAVSAGFSCSYANRQYTINHSTPNSSFTITWSGNALKRALGFSGASTSTTTSSIVSDVRPYYLIVPQIEARSRMSDVYEGDKNVVEEAVADDGTPYPIASERTINPTDSVPIRYCDWQHTMETKAAVLARSASASVPWTWEHFFYHCRGDKPFAVVETGFSTTLYALRASGAVFSEATRQRVVADYDNLWNVNLQTRDLGTL